MKKILYGLICIGLAAAMTIFVGVGSSWFTNWQVKTWFNYWWQGPQIPSEGDNPDNPSGGLVDIAEENGIKLMVAQVAPEDFEDYGVSPAADTAYTLTATVNDGAFDKSVVWGVSFANPSSDWASGKNITDYATITPATDYGLTATLTVKQAFGERIIVKVASYMDMTVNATCNVEYLKKMTSFTAILNPSLGENKGGRLYVKDIENTISINPTYDIGTVEGVISDCKTTFTVHNNTKSAISGLLTNGSGTSGFSCNASFTCTGLVFKLSRFCNTLLVGGGNATLAEIIVSNYIFQSGATDNSSSMGYDSCLPKIKYDITYSYGDYHSTHTWTDNNGCYFNKKGLSKVDGISDINFDKSEIVVVPS